MWLGRVVQGTLGQGRPSGAEAPESLLSSLLVLVADAWVAWHETAVCWCVIHLPARELTDWVIGDR